MPQRAADSDDDLSDGDDDFYDRTKKKKARPGSGGKAGAGKGKGKVEAVSVETLFGRKEALAAERARLMEAIALEEATVGEPGEAAAAAADPLDAFMSGVADEMEADKLARLQAELAEVEAEAARTERLLKVRHGCQRQPIALRVPAHTW